LTKSHKLDAIVAPTGGPAWVIDYDNGDDFLGGFSTYPAVSGYPHITLPMGLISGLPVGLSISAIHGQDQALINLAAAIEKTLDFKVAPDLPAVD
jgi:amidase